MTKCNIIILLDITFTLAFLVFRAKNWPFTFLLTRAAIVKGARVSLIFDGEGGGGAELDTISKFFSVKMV